MEICTSTIRCFTSESQRKLELFFPATDEAALPCFQSLNSGEAAHTTMGLAAILQLLAPHADIVQESFAPAVRMLSAWNRSTMQPAFCVRTKAMLCHSWPFALGCSHQLLLAEKSCAYVARHISQVSDTQLSQELLYLIWRFGHQLGHADGACATAFSLIHRNGSAAQKRLARHGYRSALLELDLSHSASWDWTSSHSFTLDKDKVARKMLSI